MAPNVVLSSLSGTDELTSMGGGAPGISHESDLDALQFNMITTDLNENIKMKHHHGLKLGRV